MYLCFCLLIGAQTRLEDRAADSLRDCLESFLDNFLFNGVDQALESFVFSIVDNLSYGKLDLCVAKEDAAEFSDAGHFLSLGADVWEGGISGAG